MGQQELYFYVGEKTEDYILCYELASFASLRISAETAFVVLFESEHVITDVCSIFYLENTSLIKICAYDLFAYVDVSVFDSICRACGASQSQHQPLNKSVRTALCRSETK